MLISNRIHFAILREQLNHQTWQIRSSVPLELSVPLRPVSAQQWVLDEIAEEHDSSESIPTWLVGVLLIIGFLVYKHLQRKDEEEQERRIKEQKYEEEQQLEEQLLGDLRNKKYESWKEEMKKKYKTEEVKDNKPAETEKKDNKESNEKK